MVRGRDVAEVNPTDAENTFLSGYIFNHMWNCFHLHSDM